MHLLKLLFYFIFFFFMSEVIRITHGEPKIQRPKWGAGRTINEGDDV